MTERDLDILLRDHVTRDEPTFPGPEGVIARGRRRTRRRRLASGVATTAAVAAVVTGVQLVTPAPQDRAGDASAVDPATRRALADYDPLAMPGLIDDAARRVLSPHVPDLGPADISVSDGNGAQVPPRHYDKASSMGVSYSGDDAHRVSVSLDHARGEAEGPLDASCEDSLKNPLYIDCAAERVGGDTVITRTWALRESAQRGGPMEVVDQRGQQTIDPSLLLFEHTVKVIKSETFVTYASELVRASSIEAADDRFRVPVADLVSLARDPELVIPPPPADPGSGCDAWMLPGSGITCTTE